MLPTWLMPTGALATMRAQAQSFMQDTIALYTPTLTYDRYGTQIVASGTPNTIACYFGDVSGSDKELVSETLQSIVQRDGAEIRSVATALLPFETVVTNDMIARKNDKDWHVIWNSNDTSDFVQLYTKLIVAHIVRRDEKETR
jgi:hypothetical protein